MVTLVTITVPQNQSQVHILQFHAENQLYIDNDHPKRITDINPGCCQCSPLLAHHRLQQYLQSMDPQMDIELEPAQIAEEYESIGCPIH